MTWWICSFQIVSVVSCVYNFLECIHTIQNNIVYRLSFIVDMVLYSVIVHRPYVCVCTLYLYLTSHIGMQSDRCSYVCFVFVYVSQKSISFRCSMSPNENLRYFDSLMVHFAHMQWIKKQWTLYAPFIIQPYWMCSCVFSV